MIVKETKDIEEIKTVLCTPEIYKCIAGYGSPKAVDFEPPMTDEYTYVAGYVDGDIIALMVYHSYKDGLECHIQVLPEYRKQYAKEFARIAVKFGDAKNAILYAEIPVCYPNVLAFSKAFGFEETGIIENGCVRDGEEHDVITLRLENGIR